MSFLIEPQDDIFKAWECTCGEAMVAMEDNPVVCQWCHKKWDRASLPPTLDLINTTKKDGKPWEILPFSGRAFHLAYVQRIDEISTPLVHNSVDNS